MARQKGVIVPIKAEDDYSREFERLKATVQELRQKVSDLRSELGTGGPGRVLGEGMEHAVPQVAAASGAIRELEGSLPIRAVERFLTTTAGLGPALSAAFPLVGAIAFGGILFENGKKLYDLEQKGKHAGEEIGKAFGELNTKLRASNDELALSNARLEDEIGKLSGHPTNGLASSLAEARVEADKLQESLAADLKQLESLLKEHEVGTLEGIISGVASNKDAEKDIKATADAMEKASAAEQSAYLKELAEIGNDHAKREALDKQHFEKMAEISEDAARKMRAKATEIAQQQKAVDEAFDQSELQGNAAGPKPDGSTKRIPYEQAAEAFDSIANRARLSGINVVDTGQKDSLTAARESAEAKAKRDRLAKELQDAMQKEAAAERQLEDAEAKTFAAQQKASDDEELDALEVKHKAMLVSDEDFNRQRAAIQQKTIAAQRESIASQKGDLDGQYDALTNSPVPTDKKGQAEYYAKILDIVTKKVELDAKDAELQASAAKSVQQGLDAEVQRAKLRESNANSVAARLEGVTGESTGARQKQSRDEYDERRRRALQLGADDGTLQQMDRQQGIDQASIGVRGAEQTYGAANSAISASRSQIADDAARGRISSLQAQQEKIALDQEEAQSIQPLIAAYQQLADAGDLAAAEKVIQLQQEVRKLNDPINEVAASVRNQLDTAFESLFENLDKGQKAWKNFGEALKNDVLKDAFKQFVEPTVQSGLGLLIPNGKNSAANSLPSGSKGGFASALGGLIPGVASKLPGVTAQSGAGAPVVNIINQTTTPVQGTATSGGSGAGLTEALRGPWIEILMTELDRGGAAAQAIAGIGAYL